MHTHFFGELDLDLSQTKNDVVIEARNITESCGYIIETYSNSIFVESQDHQFAVIQFNGDFVQHAMVKESSQEWKSII
jgi:hypothetical protein